MFLFCRKISAGETAVLRVARSGVPPMTLVVAQAAGTEDTEERIDSNVEIVGTWGRALLRPYQDSQANAENSVFTWRGKYLQTRSLSPLAPDCLASLIQLLCVFLDARAVSKIV
jgi:hypothetical protein